MSNCPIVFDFDLKPPPGSAGCVLAGGKSERMGTDKALLDFEGKTFIEHAIEKLSCFPEVYISARDVETYAFTGVPVIPDVYQNMGPLSGFISALSDLDANYVCFRSVDSPLVPAGLHPLIAGLCEGKDAAVPIYKGHVEPLLVCMSKTMLPTLMRQAENGNFKIADAFSLRDAVYVNLGDPEMIREFGDPRDYLVNANEPETLKKLRKRR